MSNARLRLAFAGETMFEHGGTPGSPMSPLLMKSKRPPRAPFFLRAWGNSRFPAPLHAHGPTEVGP